MQQPPVKNITLAPGIGQASIKLTPTFRATPEARYSRSPDGIFHGSG